MLFPCFQTLELHFQSYAKFFSRSINSNKIVVGSRTIQSFYMISLL